MTKKLITMLLSVVMLLTLSALPVSAENLSIVGDTEVNQVWSMSVLKTGEQYIVNNDTGEKIIKAFGYNENGEIVEISLDEHLNNLNTMPRVPTGTATTPLTERAEHENSGIMPAYTYFLDYRETKSYVGLGDPVKVSADSRGGTIEHLNSTSVSHTFGGEVSITRTIKEAIEFGASFDWHTSLSSETSNGYTYEVPDGEIGYVQFTPYLNVSIGDLYEILSAPFVTEEFYEGEVWGQTPKELAGGFADGLFELVIK